EEPEAGGEAVLGDRAAEPADEVLAGGEQDLVAGLGGGAGQRDRQHGLAGSRGPYEDDAGGLVDEAEGGEVADEGLVGAWLGGEVVVLDPPGGRGAAGRRPRRRSRWSCGFSFSCFPSAAGRPWRCGCGSWRARRR